MKEKSEKENAETKARIKREVVETMNLEAVMNMDLKKEKEKDEILSEQASEFSKEF